MNKSKIKRIKELREGQIKISMIEIKRTRNVHDNVKPFHKVEIQQSYKKDGDWVNNKIWLTTEEFKYLPDLIEAFNETEVIDDKAGQPASSSLIHETRAKGGVVQ